MPIKNLETLNISKFISIPEDHESYYHINFNEDKEKIKR